MADIVQFDEPLDEMENEQMEDTIEDYVEEETEPLEEVEEVEGLDAKKEMKQLASSVYGTSITSIHMALALAAALAWNELIKYLIDKYIVVGGNSVWSRVAYAVLVTILFAVIYYVIDKWAKSYLKNDKVIFAVSRS